MKRIFMVVFASSILLLSCKEKEDNVINDQAGDYMDMKSLTSEQQQIYSALIASFNDLKALYDYKPEGFNVSLFDDIKNKFGNTYYENFKETIYAAFKGDVATIDNLKKIVADSIETKDEYMSALNGRPLLYRLNELGNILFLFLNNDSVFGNDGLIKIRDRQDIALFNEVKYMLDDMRVKWDELVSLLQNTINNVSVFASKYIETRNVADKEAMIAQLEPIVELKSLDANQSCKGVICKLKNEFMDLYSQIKEKSVE
ncbi:MULTISPECIES: hypothetical protein [Borrelia]|uniref:Lipoprotein n=2 Tax=Borrelia TaxID=138 RepID=W5SL72_9SPIR|nr:hypothetical protein [Borrelia crocidurae]ACH93843.1 putative lipoprotein [Borrelia duttonii Ly]AHH07418.1 Hypothetical protein BCD_1352 [Borrelia crocidurae DOU]